MPSGGARPRSGPAPDPNALRRDRKDDQATWVTLPSRYDGPVPEWPLTVDPSPQEIIHWKRLWQTPQASIWAVDHLSYEVALYVRRLVEAEVPGAPEGVARLVNQMQGSLGLSKDGLLKHRWRIAA